MATNRTRRLHSGTPTNKKQSVPTGTVRTSLNMDNDVHTWIEEEAKKHGTNRSAVIHDIIRRRMSKPPTGLFQFDVEWLLDELRSPDNKGSIIWKSSKPNGETKLNWDGIYKIYHTTETAPKCMVLATSQVRDNLDEVFKETMLLSIEVSIPIILLVPYKLNPRHRVWAALEKNSATSVCTPDKLQETIQNLINPQSPDPNINPETAEPYSALGSE